MCGPIAMMLPVDRTNQTKKATQIITYHLGRVSAYATIGFVLVCWKGFFMAGLQQNLSIFIGVAMIVVVVIQTNFL
jgi:sulfite exporter TauE/SafE